MQREMMASTFQSLMEKGSDDSITSCFAQELLHEDLIHRHSMVLSQIRQVKKVAQNLHQEHVNLKMTNLELRNKLNLLVNKAKPFGVPAFGNGLRRMNVNEATLSNPISSSVVDLGPSQVGRGGAERVRLPKSISVRSRGYVKGSEAGSSCGSSTNDAGTRKKVYVGAGKEEPLELEVYNQGMVKTELCNKWQQTGTCSYGPNCQFAHGIEELRPVVWHPRYKTEVCRMVLNGVPCPYGHSCHFRHTLTEQEKSMTSMPLRPFNLSTRKNIVM